MGKVEEEHLRLVVMCNQICERFLVLGTTLRVFCVDTSIWCMQRAVSLSWGVGEPSNFRGAAPGCGGHGQGRDLSWGTGDTVCKGRTSA